MKEVTITKTVPVNNIETLRAWLSGQLRDYLDKPEGVCLDTRKALVGSRAIDLILEAGFTIEPLRTKSINKEAIDGAEPFNAQSEISRLKDRVVRLEDMVPASYD